MSTIPSEFKWTGTGQAAFKRSKQPLRSSDFSISRDGDNRWVFRHYQFKSPVAVFDGDNATQALRALKVALVTVRLTNQF